MSSILTTKTLGIVGGIAGVSAVGGGIFYLSSKQSTPKQENKSIIVRQSVSKLLENEKSLMLITENEQGNAWTEAWTKFKDKYTSENLSVNWGSLQSKISTSSVPAEFKKACKTNSKQKVENNQAQIYKEVKEYCTKAKPAT